MAWKEHRRDNTEPRRPMCTQSLPQEGRGGPRGWPTGGLTGQPDMYTVPPHQAPPRWPACHGSGSGAHPLRLSVRSGEKTP